MSDIYNIYFFLINPGFSNIYLQNAPISFTVGFKYILRGYGIIIIMRVITMSLTS